MQFHRLWPALLVATVLTGCSERPSTPLAPDEAGTAPGAASTGRPAQARLERLARRTARALRDPAFRADVKAALDRSTYPEGKVQFQRYLKADGGRGLRLLASADGEKEADVDDDAARSGVLEMYLPVPAHRAAWTGDGNVLVATAERDGEAPVAFDLAGHRIVLDKDTPPVTPVIAVEPAELDFDAPAPVEHMLCSENCSSGGGGSATPPTPGLYMTHVDFTGTFESWLKGDPEYEIHIMGPAAKGDTTNLVTFQCIGEHAASPYSWNPNVTSWSGNQLLFTMTQINAMKKSFPGVPFTIMAFEDDDTACQIKTDSDRASRLFAALAAAFHDWKSAQGYDLGNTRVLDAAQSGFKLLAAIYSFLTTGDDIIGVAISDSVSGRVHSGTNWTFMNDKGQANGWVQLIMK